MIWEQSNFNLIACRLSKYSNIMWEQCALLIQHLIEWESERVCCLPSATSMTAAIVLHFYLFDDNNFAIWTAKIHFKGCWKLESTSIALPCLCKEKLKTFSVDLNSGIQNIVILTKHFKVKRWLAFQRDNLRRNHLQKFFIKEKRIKDWHVDYSSNDKLKQIIFNAIECSR